MTGNPSSRYDDVEFVSRIFNGDELAEELFISKYRARFIRTAWRSRVPEQDCQDVAQDALLNALRQMREGHYRGESSLSTWLERIVLGAISNYFRRLSKEPPPKLLDNGELLSPDSLPATQRNQVEIGVIVREALLDLSPESKIILLLKHTEGYTLKEISNMLGISPGQASSKLYKAQQEFRERLEMREKARRDCDNRPRLRINDVSMGGA